MRSDASVSLADKADAPSPTTTAAISTQAWRYHLGMLMKDLLSSVDLWRQLLGKPIQGVRLATLYLCGVWFGTLSNFLHAQACGPDQGPLISLLRSLNELLGNKGTGGKAETITVSTEPGAGSNGRSRRALELPGQMALPRRAQLRKVAAPGNSSTQECK
jgi:hypothetical protein